MGLSFRFLNIMATMCCVSSTVGYSTVRGQLDSELYRRVTTTRRHSSRGEASSTRRGLSTETPREPLAANNSSASWAGAGGDFGLSADWQEVLSMPAPGGGVASLRGDACLTGQAREEVRAVFDRRRTTPSDKKVAICVRTKDFGRFLPEWVAFHYAIGVDEISIYDDDSVDNTVEVLQPFIDAGMVLYVFEKIGAMRSQMRPLNHCLEDHLERRKTDPEAPSWLLFHDTDEYIFPVDTNLTIFQALNKHSSSCCAQVHRVQYGTGGYSETPQGLIIEAFLTHAHLQDFKANRLPKVMVNLDPVAPSMGEVQPPLKSMHGANGCVCDRIPVSALRINHYLGSTGDYLDRTRRSWKEGYSHDKVMFFVKDRDINDEFSSTITSWACATREVLWRVVQGINLDANIEDHGPQ